MQFELLDPARGSMLARLDRRGGSVADNVFPSRIDHARPISTRQYARLVDEWVTGLDLRCENHGTHSLRRTKASTRRISSSVRPEYALAIGTRRPSSQTPKV